MALVKSVEVVLQEEWIGDHPDPVVDLILDDVTRFIAYRDERGTVIGAHGGFEILLDDLIAALEAARTDLDTWLDTWEG